MQSARALKLTASTPILTKRAIFNLRRPSSLRDMYARAYACMERRQYCHMCPLTSLEYSETHICNDMDAAIRHVLDAQWSIPP